MNLQEFLHMGGYAFYVWTSYGLWAVILVLNILASRQREREVRQRIRNRLES